MADKVGDFVNGSANATDGGPTSNMTLESFTTTSSSAVSVVNIQNTFRVTHDFHPSSRESRPVRGDRDDHEHRGR